MKVLEFGDPRNKKIVLVHGFLSPYQMWDKYIEYYKNKYCIVVPILPGHNPDTKEEFIDFNECTNEFLNYYINRYGTDVYLLFGTSMGGIFSMNLVEANRLNIEKIIIESSPLLKWNNMITKYLTNNYLNLTHNIQKRNEKTIMQALSSIVTEDHLKTLFDVIDNISDDTVKNYIHAICKYEIPKNLKLNNTKFYFYYGSKNTEIVFKYIARKIKKYYPNVKTICFKGKGHCEDTILNADIRIKGLDKILESDD